MVTPLKRENALFAGGKRHCFEGCLDRFETRIAEYAFARLFPARPPFESDPAQFTAQFCFQRMGMNIAHGVEQPRHLLLSSANDSGVGMPGSSDTKRPSQIQVSFSFRVPYTHSLSSLPHDGPSPFWVQMSDIP